MQSAVIQPTLELATFQPQISTETPTPTVYAVPTFQRTPVRLSVIGNWNVRKSPSPDGIIDYVQIGGTVYFYEWAENGFIRIGDEQYICGRAIGANTECVR
jgi:hypothetical protein